MIHPYAIVASLHAIVASLELVRRAYKPRLYKWHGVWLCTGLKGDGWLVTMWGDSPSQAYEAWASLQRHMPGTRRP